MFLTMWSLKNIKSWKYLTKYIYIRYLLRFFDCLAHPNLSATFATDQKWPICHLRISYQSLAGSLRSLKKSEFLKLFLYFFNQSLAQFTIVLIRKFSTMVNGTVLNFGKRYKDNLRVTFDQWPKLHLGLDALSNQKILKGIY